MQTAEYTPFKVKVIAQEDHTNVYLVKTSHGNFFAKTYSAADANLIAACPEMLSACKAALESLTLKFPFFNNPPLTTEEMQAWISIEKLNYAIAKAEGRDCEKYLS